MKSLNSHRHATRQFRAEEFYLSTQEPRASFAAEIVLIVVCLSAITLVLATVDGRLDALAAKLFAMLGAL